VTAHADSLGPRLVRPQHGQTPQIAQQLVVELVACQVTTSRNAVRRGALASSSRSEINAGAPIGGS
jgi:hypothetical protein